MKSKNPQRHSRKTGFAFPIAILFCVAFLALGGCERIISNSHHNQTNTLVTVYRDAVFAFFGEYGMLPVVTPDSEMQSNRDVYAVLNAPAGPIGGNRKGVVFLDAPSGNLVDGEVIDAWGIALFVAVDHDADGIISPGGTPLHIAVGIWSSGPDRSNDFGQGDDIGSW